ncbi:hypothetical protein ACSBR1_019260 [Camellia fascicularis]
MLIDVLRKVEEKLVLEDSLEMQKVLGFLDTLESWRNVVIETDYQDAIKLINEGAHPNCLYRALVEDIKFLTSPNQCIDALAHMGENQVKDLKIYEDSPISLSPF